MRSEAHACFTLVSPRSIVMGMPLTVISSWRSALALLLASCFVARSRPEILSRVSMNIPPFILLNPIARVEGESLSNAVIAEFCYALAPTRLVVVGQSRRKIDTPENCVDLTNRTSLLQLIRLIRIARFVVSVDSGPMHIAAAVNGRLLSIHTCTDPRRVGSYNPNAWIWKDGKILRVSELENTKLKRHGRPFKTKDVPAIVELIRPLVPIDPMLA